MEAAAYRARRPAETPLYALLESLVETVKGTREDLFARRYGFWRGLLDGVLARYLDCDSFERRFARIRCPDCASAYLSAISCKGRGLCPSCGARRAAEFAGFLQDEVVADVGHTQRVFTVPKLLRPYYMHHPALLGPLFTSITMAWQTVRELMAVAAGEDNGFRPGMVAMSQTFGDQHPPPSRSRARHPRRLDRLRRVGARACRRRGVARGHQIVDPHSTIGTSVRGRRGRGPATGLTEVNAPAGFRLSTGRRPASPSNSPGR